MSSRRARPRRKNLQEGWCRARRRWRRLSRARAPPGSMCQRGRRGCSTVGSPSAKRRRRTPARGEDGGVAGEPRLVEDGTAYAGIPAARRRARDWRRPRRPRGSEMAAARPRAGGGTASTGATGATLVPTSTEAAKVGTPRFRSPPGAVVARELESRIQGECGRGRWWRARAHRCRCIHAAAAACAAMARTKEPT